MELSSRESMKALSHLYGIVDAGERGYAFAAANVNNRGLKLLFKTYARQRAEFKQELKGEIERIAAAFKPQSSFPAMVRRGRINIFAALTIGVQGRERVVMREVLTGERAALNAYESALKKSLPADATEIVERQYQAMQKVVDEVRLLRGRDGKQRMVRLYDTEADAAQAIKALKGAHFDSASMEKISKDKATSSYDESMGSTLLETILAGAAGGATWGFVSGALSGFGVLHLPGLGLEHAPLLIQQQVWAEVALGAIAAGSFVGAVLGTFIGWGVQGGDAYLYDRSLERGQVLLTLETEEGRAAEAWQMMAQVNREAQVHSKHSIA